MDQLETFSHDHVRALAWCVGAPGLMMAVDGLAVPSAQVFSAALDAAGRLRQERNQIDGTNRS